MTLHQTAWLRRALLPILAKVNAGDITITHHFTGDSVRLHSFKHKGYWFHGRRREAETMAIFAALIGPGETVCEVGGHIGYISLFFAAAVGPNGQVHVFEPGPNNHPYISRNVGSHRNIFLQRCGVGSSPGQLPLYVEELSGQNNSFVKDFDVLRDNERVAHVKAGRSMVLVPVVTLDTFFRDQRVSPDFVKIDVEGFEYEVLQGMRSLLATRAPRLMVEIQSNEQKIFDLLQSSGYAAFTPGGHSITSAAQLQSNTFFLHSGDPDGLQQFARATRTMHRGERRRVGP